MPFRHFNSFAEVIRLVMLMYVRLPRRVQLVVATHHFQDERGASDEAAEADLLLGSATCGDLGQVAAR
jgi:hypothetical protein